jgi:hypothetical protein
MLTIWTSRTLMVSFGLPGIWRPGDGKRSLGIRTPVWPCFSELYCRLHTFMGRVPRDLPPEAPTDPYE